MTAGQSSHQLSRPRSGVGIGLHNERRRRSGQNHGGQIAEDDAIGVRFAAETGAEKIRSVPGVRLNEGKLVVLLRRTYGSAEQPAEDLWGE